MPSSPNTLGSCLYGLKHVEYLLLFITYITYVITYSLLEQTLEIHSFKIQPLLNIQYFIVSTVFIGC